MLSKSTTFADITLVTTSRKSITISSSLSLHHIIRNIRGIPANTKRKNEH